MPADPIQIGAAGIDLSGRVFSTATVVGSPAAAAETVVAQVSIGPELGVGLGVLLLGYAAFTVGTNGTAVTTRLRRDSVAGTIVKSSGALTATAAQLIDRSIVGVDLSPTLPNEVYVLTLEVTAGSAASTVSATSLIAVVI